MEPSGTSSDDNRRPERGYCLGKINDFALILATSRHSPLSRALMRRSGCTFDTSEALCPYLSRTGARSPMTYTKSGILLLTVATVVFLVATAATTGPAPLASHILLGLSALSAIGLIMVAGKASVAPLVASTAPPNPPGAWDKWPQVLGGAVFALICLLLWAALFIALHLGYGTWVIYPAVIMVAIWLSLIVLYATGIAD